MIATEPAPRGARAARFFDGLESFGLVVLLVGLPVSEAAKSAGLFLATLGFIGRRVCRSPFPGWRRAPMIALAVFFTVGILSMLVQAPAAWRPQSLFTLAMTVVVFPIVLDACGRPSRRTLLVNAIVAGGAIAAVAGYADYMADHWLRLVLPSIENAVPAAEYLGAVAALALAVLFAEWRSTVTGPAVGFGLGVMWLTLFMTKSRGPIIGAAFGAVAAVGTSLRKRHAALLLVVIVLGAVLFWRARPEARTVDDLLVGSRSAASRLFVWRRTAEHIAARPVLGHGVGNFERLMIVYEDEHGPIHVRNAHNAYLQVTAEVGLLGSGALVAFLVLGIRGVLQAIRRTPRNPDRALSIGALAGVVAILVAGVFSVSIDAEPGMLCYALLAVGQPGRR